jgi:transcriptional regulator with XRE-family HTH domain
MATIHHNTTGNDGPINLLRLALLPESEPCIAQSSDRRPMQRLRKVRRRQGMSCRAVARRLRTTIANIRLQERPTSDISLSDLYRWRQGLEVPAAELVAESAENLAAAVQKRAHLLRLMRTAVQIVEMTEEEPVRQMAQTMIAELVRIMPELQNVSGWHSIGKRRRQNEYGVAVDRGLGDSSWRFPKAA